MPKESRNKVLHVFLSQSTDEENKTKINNHLSLISLKRWGHHKTSNLFKNQHLLKPLAKERWKPPPAFFRPGKGHKTGRRQGYMDVAVPRTHLSVNKSKAYDHRGVELCGRMQKNKTRPSGINHTQSYDQIYYTYYILFCAILGEPTWFLRVFGIINLKRTDLFSLHKDRKRKKRLSSTQFFAKGMYNWYIV